MTAAYQQEKAFYGALATDYDAMTGFADRLRAADDFVERLADAFCIRRAADVACGSGAYALALAQQGVETVGTDVSREMIAAAETHTRELGLDDKVRWKVGSMQETALGFDAFDLLLCMANSVPHLLTQQDLSRALKNFYVALRPRGILVFQLLNYERILREKERIVSINRQDNREFIRFYDFLEDGTVRFNVLRVYWPSRADVSPKHRLDSVRLYPYTSGELRRALDQHGFKDIETCGSLQFEEFNARKSDTLLLTARA